MPKDHETAVKKLEEEKKALEEKCKSLAQIIELASQQQPKADEKIAADSGEKIKTHFAELKKSINSMVRKLEDVGKSKAKGTEAGEEVKTGLAGSEKNSRDLERVSALEGKIKKLEGMLNPEGNEPGLFGGFQKGSVQKPRASDVEKKLAIFEEVLDDLQIQVTAKITDLNKKVEALSSKLNDRTVKKLEELVDSEEDVEKLISLDVRGEINNILSTFSFEIKNLSEDIKELTKETESMNTQMKYSLSDIKKMESGLEKLETRLNTMEREIWVAAKRSGPRTGPRSGPS